MRLAIGGGSSACFQHTMGRLEAHGTPVLLHMLVALADASHEMPMSASARSRYRKFFEQEIKRRVINDTGVLWQPDMRRLVAGFLAEPGLEAAMCTHGALAPVFPWLAESFRLSLHELEMEPGATDALLARAAAMFPNLRAVQATQNHFTDAGLERLHAMLPHLQHLDIDGSRDLTRFRAAADLVELSISSCERLASLDLRGCPALAGLYISDCRKLVRIEGVDRLQRTLTNLQVGYPIPGFEDLVRLPALLRLEVYANEVDSSSSVVGGDTRISITTSGRLRELEIHDVQEIQTLACAGDLETLTVNGCNSLGPIDLTGCQRLRQLEMQFCPRTRLVWSEEGLPELRKLSLHFLAHLEHLPLVGFGNLTDITIQGCPALTLPDVSGLTALETLVLAEMALEIDADWLTSLHVLPKLRYLDISASVLPADLETLQPPPSLWTLALGPESLDGQPMAALHTLDLTRCTQLKVLRVLGCPLRSLVTGHLGALQSLTLRNSPRITGLDLSANAELESLELLGCPQIEVLRMGPRNSRQLERVYIEAAPRIGSGSIRGLRVLAGLGYLFFDSIRHGDLEYLRAELPDANIKGDD